MIDLLLKIIKKKQRLSAYFPISPIIIKNLNEWFKVELTYTSNAIEGNTLTRQETALIVEKGITVEGKTIVEHVEAVNHGKAWDYILGLKETLKIEEISEDIIREIHAHILRNIDQSNAGIYRNVSVRIAGSTVVMPNPIKVPSLMKDFISWLKEFAYKIDSAELAVAAHFKFVSIHPFVDGNGRTGRLLMNLILLLDNYPPAIIQKEERMTYINAIEKGQLTQDLSDYLPFMYMAINRSLDIYLESIEPNFIPEKPVLNKLLKIGELANQTNETTSTIRHWTKSGLLKVKKRTASGYQLYDESAVERVEKIRELQTEKRLTIKELKKNFL